MNETFYRTSTDEERVFYNYSDQYPLYLERDCLSTYPNFSAESHWHDEVELLICHSGQMDYNINGTILSITEIAYAVGFHGASYYAETFRKWMGCNPREFRLTNKQIQISC